MSWGAESLEPIQQVVSQLDDLGKRLVGQKVLCGDLSQRIGILQLADDQFGAGPLIVEAPQVQGGQREIGDEDLVGVAAHLEQMQWRRRLFGKRLPDHHKASRSRPSMGGSIETLPPTLPARYGGSAVPTADF